MKYVLWLALLIGGPAWGGLWWVRDRNAAVAAGTAAYARGDAAGAGRAFAAALAANTRRPADPQLLLNLGHAQVRAGLAAAARATYGRLLSSPATENSLARQQLAVLAAQRGQAAQALGLLRQALLLDPRNTSARYNYEVLSAYLAQRPAGPRMAPADAPAAPAPKPAPPAEANPASNPSKQPRPGEKPGADRPGEVSQPQAAGLPPTTPPGRRPDATGQPDPSRPSAAPGAGAAGGAKPGQGLNQPVPTGDAGGPQRGLDRSSVADKPAAGARSSRPGAEVAIDADGLLQTQRERLQAMSLSPTQARQLLETLRAQEQQYLQQLTRPSAQKPDLSKPTW